jgi:hypothetical protein
MQTAHNPRYPLPPSPAALPPFRGGKMVIPHTPVLHGPTSRARVHGCRSDAYTLKLPVELRVVVVVVGGGGRSVRVPSPSYDEGA